MRDQICNTSFKPSSPVHCKQCTSSYTRYSIIDAIYLVQQLINIVIILLCSITEIITASPPGLRKSALLATNHSRQWYINATWSPDISQYGPNLFCYSATDSAGWVGRICSTMISITCLISLNILFSTQFLFSLTFKISLVFYIEYTVWGTWTLIPWVYILLVNLLVRDQVCNKTRLQNCWTPTLKNVTCIRHDTVVTHDCKAGEGTLAIHNKLISCSSLEDKAGLLVWKKTLWWSSAF